MGYMHIENLYRNKTILLFKECYALEKIHGTSAHIRWQDTELTFFSGGIKHDSFVALFDQAKLAADLQATKFQNVTIYGEAYGGSCQAMRDVYGETFKFVAFDVLHHDKWLSVPKAQEFVTSVGLEFVDYRLVPADLVSIDAERDRESVQAIRNRCGTGKPREGVVLRPVIEVTDHNGNRIMCKHKIDKFRETKSSRPVDAKRQVLLEGAKEIAEEYVTDMRLQHILDKLPEDQRDIKNMRTIILSMVEDVYREGSGEFVESREVVSAIGVRTAILFRARLNTLVET